MPTERRVSRRLTILDLLLTAGEAVGIWLIGRIDVHAPDEETWLSVLILGLGGLSLVGPPLLL
jgi:hypothetical protein